jgi:hypothetical protein
MTTNRLAKNYSALTPAERLTLLIAASARGDDLEHPSLIGAAPRVFYSVPHTFGRATGFCEVTEQDHMELLALEPVRQPNANGLIALAQACTSGNRSCGRRARAR